jgi:competence protein ComEC
MPLVAYYFHLVTPVSLFANFVIVPLSSLALMANIGSLFCGNWFPFAGELFNHSGWLFMKWMVGTSHWFASLPMAFANVPAPSIFACAVYYTLLFTLLNGWLFVPRKRPLSAALLVFATLTCAWTWHAETRTAKITILPLSGGDSVFVDCAGRANDLLVDCGNENAAQFTLEPFLRAQGVNSIANLVLTHGDLRHVGGTDWIQQNFSVQKILTSEVPAKSSTYRQLLSKLHEQPERWKALADGDSLGVWMVLHPKHSDKFPQSDDNALVLRGRVFGKTILLLSDLGRPGQNVLMERHADLRADIVVAGLPAQGEPLSNALLERIQPGLIIITDCEFPATGRASRKLRERLSKQTARVIFCRDVGAVTLNFNAKGISVQVGSRAKE